MITKANDFAQLAILAAQQSETVKSQDPADPLHGKRTLLEFHFRVISKEAREIAEFLAREESAGR